MKKLAFAPLFKLCTFYSLLLITSFRVQAEAPEFTCPPSPNCVSSMASDEHKIAPFTLKENNNSAIKKKLLNTLKTWPNAEIISNNDHMIIAVFTTPLLQFKDDLILMIQPNGRVDVRSSSRVGYYDFGTNRRRVESLRAALAEN